MHSNEYSDSAAVERVLAAVSARLADRANQIRQELVRAQEEVSAERWSGSTRLSECQGALDAMVWSRSCVLQAAAEDAHFRAGR